MSLPPSIHVVSHPLVQHKLTKMRDKETSSANFRRLLREIGLLLGYDATRDLPLVKTHIETPVAGTDAPLLDRIGEHVRLHLGMDATRLPLVKILEGGTWFAGRMLAAERRPGGGPPIAVKSDGTVF